MRKLREKKQLQKFERKLRKKDQKNLETGGIERRKFEEEKKRARNE